MAQSKTNYARMESLRRKNDIWIAALALQHDLTLATRDKHFEAVEGLKVEMW